MSARVCPNDRRLMSLINVFAAGRQVELDRCSDCGSVWFDAGELEEVLELEAKKTSVESGTLCPGCTQPMAFARLKGELGAQVCYRCHGAFVQGSVMAALKSTASQLSARSATECLSGAVTSSPMSGTGALGSASLALDVVSLLAFVFF